MVTLKSTFNCLGLDYVDLNLTRYPWRWKEGKALVPDSALSMANAPSQVYSSSRHLLVHHLRLPGSTWIVRIYRIAWERSKISLQMEVFRNPHFQCGLDKWNTYNVEVSDFLVHMDYYHDHA